MSKFVLTWSAHASPATMMEGRLLALTSTALCPGVWPGVKRYVTPGTGDSPSFTRTSRLAFLYGATYFV